MGKVININLRESTLSKIGKSGEQSKVLKRKKKSTIRNKPKRKGRVYND